MSDQVKSPGHYLQFGVEVKDVIKMILNSPENACISGYDAYCMGNEIKYRLRAGFKGNQAQDMAKALEYRRMRDQTPLHADKAEMIDEILTETDTGTGWGRI